MYQYSKIKVKSSPKKAYFEPKNANRVLTAVEKALYHSNCSCISSTLERRVSFVNKSDLVSKVATASGLTKTDAEKAIEATFGAITQSLKKGEEVRLIGFGTFDIAHRAATQGRNPRTGAAIKIPATRLPKFRAGKQLKEAVAK